MFPLLFPLHLLPPVRPLMVPSSTTCTVSASILACMLTTQLDANVRSKSKYTSSLSGEADSSALRTTALALRYSSMPVQYGAVPATHTDWTLCSMRPA